MSPPSLPILKFKSQTITTPVNKTPPKKNYAYPPPYPIEIKCTIPPKVKGLAEHSCSYSLA